MNWRRGNAVSPASLDIVIISSLLAVRFDKGVLGVPQGCARPKVGTFAFVYAQMLCLRLLNIENLQLKNIRKFTKKKTVFFDWGSRQSRRRGNEVAPFVSSFVSLHKEMNGVLFTAQASQSAITPERCIIAPFFKGKNWHRIFPVIPFVLPAFLKGWIRNCLLPHREDRQCPGSISPTCHRKYTTDVYVLFL